VISDIRLDEDHEGWVTVQGDVLRAETSDFMLDCQPRRTRSGHRRALVHDETDGLTVNFNGDYPGGVTIGGPTVVHGAVAIDGGLRIRDGRLNLQAIEVDGFDPRLPSSGDPGDVVLLHHTSADPNFISSYTMWVCVGWTGNVEGGVSWTQVQLGDTVVGTGD
jgi:hypothetical protein